MNPDLFQYAERYPVAPGTKGRATSAEAAHAAKPTAATLRTQCLKRIALHPSGLTADEAAALLKLSVLSIRPRFSELAADGKITDSGHRRQNESGRRAIVWLATGRQLQTPTFGSVAP